MGFVFIEANVKKWGLAPMTGSLAPPPPYGSEQGSILLESGRESAQQTGHGNNLEVGHSRTRSGTTRVYPPTSPGPQRSSTDISLAPLSHMPSQEDVGEGPSREPSTDEPRETLAPPDEGPGAPPPEYSSPDPSRRGSDYMTLAQAASSTQPPIPSYDAAVGNDPRRYEEDRS